MQKTLKATNDIKIKTARKLESENTIKILKNKQSGVTPLGSFIYKSYYNKCKKNSNKIISEKLTKDKAKAKTKRKTKVTAKVVTIRKDILELEEKISGDIWKFNATTFLHKK